MTKDKTADKTLKTPRTLGRGPAPALGTPHT